MVLGIESYISNIYDGVDKAYIYILWSQKYKVVYVGQTNSRGGTLARINQHCSVDSGNNQFRRLFQDKTGLSLTEADDLRLFSFCLGTSKTFTSAETTYREGVEYLVQIFLYDIACESPVSFRIISVVRTNDTTSLPFIRKMATSIAHQFQGVYSRVINTIAP